jgi:hypothetical protein
MLTPGAIPEIRQKYRSGMTAKALASQYNVAEITSYAVLQGKTWRHVPDPGGPVVKRRIGRPRMRSVLSTASGLIRTKRSSSRSK